MKDETYAFISDVKEKKVTARSARNTRTHCGKGGRVRLPSDNLSKKELMKMSGECKSYRLNDPMGWKEFMSMPDDIKITYIKLLRQKFNVPVTQISKMMGVTEASVRKELKRLGLTDGKTRSGRIKWDKEGFYAWWHGVDKLPTSAPEESSLEEPEEVITSDECATFVEEDIPFEEPDICPIDPMIDHEIEALKHWNDEMQKVIDELKAVHEKDKAENEWLRNECDSLRMNVRILEAQMEVVRLIFGGKNNG